MLHWKLYNVKLLMSGWWVLWVL